MPQVETETSVTLIEKLRPFAELEARYKVAHGGRGSGKSWTVAMLLVLMASERPIRILCAREIQNSIKDSVIQLLTDTITRFGLDYFFTIQNDQIFGANGSRFFFVGLHRNVTKIKSFEGVDLVWVEEGEKITKDSWRILTPTIRKPGSEIWVTLNPDEDGDHIFKTFVGNEPPPRSLVLECNYYDNPFFPEVLEEERVHCLKTDPDAHRHIWEGQTRKNSEAQIFHGKISVERFETPSDAMFYHGLDWGFSAHPCAFAKCWIEENVLYVRVKQVYRADLEEIPEHLEKWQPGVKAWVIRADPEEPAAIRLVHNRGFNIRRASKPPGSVKAGIRYLRSFDKIVIHEDDAEMVAESRNYKYKVDPVSGDVTPIILKEHDHGWDAIRYALSILINRGTK